MRRIYFQERMFDCFPSKRQYRRHTRDLQALHSQTICANPRHRSTRIFSQIQLFWTYAVPKPNKSDINFQVSIMGDIGLCERHTVCLSKDNTIHNIRACITTSIPCILEARKRTTIEGRIGIRNVGHQCLRNRKICLLSRQKSNPSEFK